MMECPQSDKISGQSDLFFTNYFAKDFPLTRKTRVSSIKCYENSQLHLTLKTLTVYH